jgi:hypothetical protein
MFSINSQPLPQAPLSAALAAIFRGRFCDVVPRNHASKIFETDQVIYGAGDKDQTLLIHSKRVCKIDTLYRERGRR